MGGSEASKGIDAKLAQSASLEQGASNAFRMADNLQAQAQAAASGQSSLNIDLARVSPQLAKQISEISQQADFQSAVQSGNMQQATQILASGLSQQLKGSPAAMNEILDAINVKPSQGPELTSGPQGGAPVTESGLRQQFDAGAQQTREQGGAAVAGTWAQGPKVSVGGPSVSGLAGAVQSGQASMQADVDSGRASTAGRVGDLGAQVAPELPSSKGGAINVPQSQLVRVSQSLGNDAANTASGVLKGAQNIAGGLANAAAGPVGQAVDAARTASQTVLREGMQAPGRVSPSGPDITFPYNAAAERAQSNDPMGYVNEVRAKKGLPPLPSSSSQIPGQ